MSKIKALGVMLLLSMSLCYGAPTNQIVVRDTASGAVETNSTIPEYYSDKWYRDSAERIAIYREIFYLALATVKVQIATQHLKYHQWGVVLDIDETALDNSLWNEEHDFTNSNQSWNDFAKEAVSIAMPGAKAFTQEIHVLGGYVNFVSNRPVSLLPPTEKDLRSKGLYFDQVLLDASGQGTSFVNKDSRFQAILKGKAPSSLPAQNIVVYLGDNIQDFPNLTQKTMSKQNPNGSAYAIFGKKYFILPNPMYGSWEENS